MYNQESRFKIQVSRFKFHFLLDEDTCGVVGMSVLTDEEFAVSDELDGGSVRAVQVIEGSIFFLDGSGESVEIDGDGVGTRSDSE